VNITSEELIAFIASYLWPFIRIAALVSVIPILSSQVVPKRVKIGIAAALTVVIVPTLGPMPTVEILSAEGLLMCLYQMLIGLAMGFTIRIVFSAFETGGHVIGQTMGLGFAQMLDPANGITVPVISQFYTVIGTLLFLALNGHLVMIDVLSESFKTMPIALHTISLDGIWSIIALSGWIFKGAVLISLPAVSALLLVNIAFGVMMRAAPQLNIFAIGFPLSLTLGFVFILVTLPMFLPQFTHLMDGAFFTIEDMIGGK
jgi:flagellar biosynthetic protein FliR